MSLCNVVKFVLRAAQAPRGDGMKQGLPNMSAAAIDQRDTCSIPAAEPFAQLGRKFDSGRAVADNYM
jgi:hypothetical protein